MPFDSSGLEVLSRGECLALLRSVPIGRIVFTDQALPAILPVNFAVDDEQVIIRTSEGSKLAAAARNAIVAFEVDEFDVETHRGWSVTAVGHAQPVRDRDTICRLRQLPLRPWAPGKREHFIRIYLEHLSGRRIPAVVPAVADDVHADLCGGRTNKQ